MMNESDLVPESSKEVYKASHSSSKHKKHKHDKKRKEKKRRKEKERKLDVNQQPITKKEKKDEIGVRQISLDDYFLFSLEFRVWLLQTKNM